MFNSLLRNLLFVALSTLFRIACFKEYLFPSSFIKRVCGEKYEHVSLEARTLYWLLSLNSDKVFKDYRSITDEAEKFKKMAETYRKSTFTPQQLEKQAQTLKWLFLPEEVQMEKINLESTTKPAYFVEFNSNTTDALCFLYCHGGAFIAGSYMNSFHFLSSTCKELKANFMAITYDFLPDNTLHQIIEETAKEAYEYLVKEKQINPKKIVLIGESAGGNIVLNLGKIVGKNGCACVVAASPWLDLTISFENEMLQKVDDVVLTNPFVDISKTLIARDTRASYYSPMYWNNKELEQMPPIFLSVSQSEKFIFETKVFVEILSQTSTLQYQIVDQYVCVPHGYATLISFLRESKQTTEQMIQFLKTCSAKGQQ